MKLILRCFIAFMLVSVVAFPLNGEEDGLMPVEAEARPYSVEPLPGLIRNEAGVKAGLLYDVNQNKVVWEKGLYSSFPIASLTKMMTVLLVREDIRDGKISWNDVITVAGTPGRKRYGSAWTHPGQTFTYEDLVKSAMISSSNDACVLLGRNCGNTEAEFVRRMNERAISLGMYNTYFSNTHGLPAPKGSIDNFSSPHDLLILARELMKYPDVVDISGRSDEYVLLNKTRVPLKNHNRLAVEYEEVKGLKTGFTRKAGFCIVVTSVKNDVPLIAIVLGGTSPAQRNDFVAGMLNTYYHDVLCIGMMEKISAGMRSQAVLNEEQ